jgi:uncharacterized protein (TIGR03086 family)
MSEMTTTDAIGEACRTMTGIVRAAADTDLDSPTPCTDFDLRTLLTHFAGTTSGFARAGSSGDLDPDDPWGSKVELSDDWPSRLADNLSQIASGWGRADAWDGSVEGSRMPARALGEMGLIEVMLHGWDVARASGQSVEISDGLGAELLRCVSATAEQGRQFHAYGPEVEVAGDASDLDKALGLAGRDPNWTR